MRALVITGPCEADVQDVAPPRPRAGEVVVDVERAGVCGTDMEFFTGEMNYLHTGQARYPMRIGHEWAGTVSVLGDGVERRWLGRRVTGDTMIGCGRCARCVTSGTTSAPIGMRSASGTAGRARSRSNWLSR